MYMYYIEEETEFFFKVILNWEEERLNANAGRKQQLYINISTSPNKPNNSATIHSATDLAFTVDCQQLVIDTEEFTGMGNVDSGLLFISSEDPDFNSSPLKSFNGLWNLLLKSVYYSCGT